MKLTIKKNTKINYLQCLRCNNNYDFADFFEGCPRCSAENKPSSLKIVYREFDTTCALPYKSYLSMSEGNTPLIPISIDKEEFGKFHIKHEGQNPTGSHKDRMSALIVTRAIEIGAKGVVVASSGNAGISLAAYAAFGGIKCVVIASKNLNNRIQSLLKGYGANLVLTNTPEERWIKLKEYSDAGFYPASNYLTPPVGSNFIGVQGYKTIAYEILHQLQGKVPTKIIVPVSRGDLLWGIWQGFKEINLNKNIIKLPKMIAVEPFPRLTNVLNGVHYTEEFIGETRLKSLDGTTVTFQALKALQESNGLATVVTEEQAKQGQQFLLTKGIFLENSSATVIHAINQLKNQNLLKKEDIVIAMGTSSGFLEV
ncbi:pyridoxal-phosphate dependent enzyme [Bacillus cytotoxicus]|uniref:threonine synthase n=1 Tax=Bacillus cereus group TaxID=86661 RepID=UPI001F590AC1|nr:pyridoxal-phosphate dependent enzyme [Bacillus cereus group sp. BfR-BA-01492]EMA6342170.1 pyridoxal-phosphate dependent enzyme [Bacillus cytotoxicus]